MRLTVNSLAKKDFIIYNTVYIGFVADEDLCGQNVLLLTPSSSIAMRTAQYDSKTHFGVIYGMSLLMTSSTHIAVYNRLRTHA